MLVFFGLAILSTYPLKKLSNILAGKLIKRPPAPQRNESPPRSVRRAGDLLGLAAAAGGNTNLIG